MSHTPGPWAVIPNTKTGEIFITSETARRGVCQIVSWERSPWAPETRANTRLIVAAPDLLKSLKKLIDAFQLAYDRNPEACMEFMNEVADPDMNYARIAAMEAIAKAEDTR